MSKMAMTVDDSQTIRDVVAFTLEKAGFDTILKAEDGAQALDVLKDQVVDVIITDLNMPHMNGIELIRNLRADERFRYIPILMLTTEDDATKKQEAKSVGATGWLVKPFNPDKLIQVIHKVLL